MEPSRRFTRITLSPHFRDVPHVHRFFAELPAWNLTGIVVTPLDMNRGPHRSFWHGMTGPLQHWGSSPFGATAAPGLADLRDRDQVRRQIEILDEVYALCLQTGVELHFSVPLLKFAVDDGDAVRRELPGLFDSGDNLDLTSPALTDVIEQTLNDIAKRYPKLTGVEARIAEGASATIHPFTAKDLATTEDWFAPWLDRVAGFCDRQGWDLVVFPHHYEANRGDRRRLHETMAEHPQAWVLEDLTWPEEHVTLPYLGYLGDERATRLAASNPLIVNCLLDTEYMGQGLVPSVLPGWWSGGLQQALEYGARGANGRVARWDQFRSLDNWNVFNIDLFCALAHDPGADPEMILTDSLKRRFGAAAAALTPLLLQSERLIRSQTLNGIDFTSHSAFPPVRALARRYFQTPLAMQAVDDLFAPSGTRCYGVADDSLTAGDEWRHQMRTRTRASQSYTADFTALVSEIAQAERDAVAIATRFSPELRAFVQTSYALWTTQAQAFRLFVDGAAAHAEWLHTDAASSLIEMRKVGSHMARHAAAVADRFEPGALFDLSDRLMRMAGFLSNPDPHAVAVG